MRIPGAGRRHIGKATTSDVADAPLPPGAPELDIVIPVYNEGDKIAGVMEALFGSSQTLFRVLICYDFDADDTLPALEKVPPEQRDRIELVKSAGRGPHAAVVTGFRASSAPAVLMYPADDDYNLGIVDAMMTKFREGCDIVAASRFIPGGCMVGCPWLKAVLVRGANFTLYHFARIPTHDASNGFRLFSRRVIQELELESSEGFTYSLELLVKCHRRGWKIGEVPAQWHERASGRSRFRVLRWLPAYWRWYGYALATTFFGRRD